MTGPERFSNRFTAVLFAVLGIVYLVGFDPFALGTDRLQEVYMGLLLSVAGDATLIEGYLREQRGGRVF